MVQCDAMQCSSAMERGREREGERERGHIIIGTALAS